jgi:hypothetical protein
VSIFTQLSLPVCLTGSAARISWDALTDFVSVKTGSRMFHWCFTAERSEPVPFCRVETATGLVTRV